MLYSTTTTACAALVATWFWLILGGAHRCNQRSAAGAREVKACCFTDDDAPFSSAELETGVCCAAGHSSP